MNNRKFFESFHFSKIVFYRNHHTDNSTNQGVNTNYIGWLIKGTAKFVYRNKTIELKENDIIFIAKGCRYHSYWFTDENSELQWYSLGFDYFPQPDNRNYVLQKLSPSESGLKILKKITDNLAVNITNVGYLFCFLGYALPTMQMDNGPYEIITENATEYMRNHTDFKISDVADFCNISESGLYGIFKKSLGKTPNEIRQKLLCEKAEELLITTNLSVEEISNRLSFSSSSYFRKILKKHTGLTPREIRKRSDF